jgi:DNA-binding NarL/FixJ family response regulator
MPRCDGIAAIQKMKALLPDVKIIVLTSFGDEARVKLAIESGADGYLLKDADGQNLIDAIAAVQCGGMPLHPQVATRLIRARDAGQRRKESMRLTAREGQILRLVATGLSNRAIAGALGLRTGTVKIHVSSILAKLNVSNRTEAASWATQLGLVVSDSEDQPENI